MAPSRLALVFAALLGVTAIVIFLYARGHPRAIPPGWNAVGYVADGDTIVLRGGVTVRLVQIDTPEVHFRPECYGEQASEETKRLLPGGTLVRLVRDTATDGVDSFGRLLRYVVRKDERNVNLALVADGAAAPYFYEGVRGAHADELVQAAAAARSAGRGLWGACPRTKPAYGSSVATGLP